jgi:hypothetical protein
MKAKIFAISLIMCGCTATDYPDLFLVTTQPTEWSEYARSSLSKKGILEICSAYNRGGSMTGGNLHPYSVADFKIIEVELKRRGLTGRDIELLRSRRQTYGTGQTYTGLICSLVYEPQINQAYYPGIGNQWQAVLYGGDYVYLEGDGTPRGMHVTSWN